ncbi:MAG: hypothetical protein VW576_05390 [Opitutae bacterium]
MRLTISLLFLFIWVTGCQTGSQPGIGQMQTDQIDGFTQKSFEKISLGQQENEEQKKSLNLESEWLKLRAQVVEAEKYACECRSSELNLVAEMARFGSFDQRLPESGFINEEERTRWNAQLEMKKTARVTAEARANLLRRDLHDLCKKIDQEGFQAPVGSVFD